DDWTRAKLSGVNPTQLSILELLEGREGGLSVKDVAFHLAVSQPTATDSIAALERKGYVEKRPIKNDKRAVRVGLTSQGRSALQAGGAVEGDAEQATEMLGEQEQEEFLLTLVKMIRILQEREAIPIQRMCA